MKTYVLILVIVAVILVGVLGYSGITGFAVSSETTVKLSSNSPIKEMTLDNRVYLIELESASDTSAVISVKEKGSNDATKIRKEISEGSSKVLSPFEIFVKSADETNLKLKATLVVSEMKVTYKGVLDMLKKFSGCETKISLDDKHPKKEVILDGVSYAIELVSSSDTAATIKATNEAGVSDEKEVGEGISKSIGGLTVTVNNADETNSQLKAILTLSNC